MKLLLDSVPLPFPLPRLVLGFLCLFPPWAAFPAPLAPASIPHSSGASQRSSQPLLEHHSQPSTVIYLHGVFPTWAGALSSPLY